MITSFALADIIGKREEESKERYRLNKGDYITKYTIMTIATMDWLMNDWHSSKHLNKMFYEYYKKYSEKSDKIYGCGLHSWLEKGAPWYRTDYDASCAVWASVVGHKANNMRELKRLIKRIVRSTHNTEPALKSAEVVSIVIYLDRKGYSKERIIKYLNHNYGYTPCNNIIEEIENHEFTNNAKTIIYLTLDIIFNSTNYQDVCKYAGMLKENKSIISCLAGSIAEPYFKFTNTEYLANFKKIFPKEYYTILKKFEKYEMPSNLN